jgi:hypothetical protein
MSLDAGILDLLAEPGCRLEYGIVDTVSPLKVFVAGSATSTTCETIAGVAADDFVAVLVKEGDRLVLGVIGSGPGKVARAVRTTSAGPFAAITDIGGLSVTWTPKPLREFKITAETQALASVAGSLGRLVIADGADVEFQSGQVPCPLTSDGFKLTSQFLWSSSAAPAAQTFKVRGARGTGSGNMTFFASATAPMFLLIEDIGPA